eukprot:764358-Hanusia_phi.AAC.3
MHRPAVCVFAFLSLLGETPTSSIQWTSPATSELQRKVTMKYVCLHIDQTSTVHYIQRHLLSSNSFLRLLNLVAADRRYPSQNDRMCIKLLNQERYEIGSAELYHNILVIYVSWVQTEHHPLPRDYRKKEQVGQVDMGVTCS